MDKSFLIELFGYLGSFIVLVSFIMTSQVKLRIVNTIGSIIFTIYAFIIKSYPTAIMNLVLILINIYYLKRNSVSGNNYHMIECNYHDQYVQFFIEYYKDNIQKCFPGINYKESEINKCFLITINTYPVGLTLGIQKNSSIELTLDYSTPQYRDNTIGTFLINYLASNNIRTVVYNGPDINHIRYLTKLGFKKTESGYIKQL